MAIGLAVMGDANVTKLRWKAAGLCRQCGKHPALSGRAWCAACRETALVKWAEKRAVDVATREPKVCAHCGKNMGVDYKPNGGRPSKFCSGACAAKSKNKGPQQKACGICAVTFIAMHGEAFCSSECRKEQARRWMRSYSMSKKRIVQRVCPCCRQEFAPEYGDFRRVYCSEMCAARVARRVAKAKRRAAERGLTAESVDPIRVFGRDKWHCQLCGIKTPRSARGTYQDDAPELDHIVPLSLGGPHTYANTQCACRKCNGMKGAKPLGQPRLIA